MRFCNDDSATAYESGMSINKILSGPPNPRTLEPIELTPNVYSDVWRTTPHSSTNTERDSYLRQMGHGLHDTTAVQYLQPGVLQTQAYLEPINSSTGIDRALPFPPTYLSDFTDYRHSSYSGPADRRYACPITGQIKYDYSDVDRYLRPNYITRTDVDIFPWAESYGQLHPPPAAAPQLVLVKARANEQFHDDAMRFRVEMQERLMRKNNAVNVQRRRAPIHTRY